ncbi:MAG TPA: hypothetical protein VJM11_03655 [Nevskiaceae bacterium]|nr:hypothetical protein [Nevskiaceae bacterium]
MIEVENHTPAAFADVLQEIETRTKRASEESAQAVRREAQGRVARRTGATAAAIVVVESYDGQGYVVLVDRQHMPRLPYWLEYGTRYMTARPFLFASALLEEGPHERRITEAVETGIAAAGLGA